MGTKMKAGGTISRKLAVGMTEDVEGGDEDMAGEEADGECFASLGNFS
jgi:hypothetical protein